MPSRKPTLSPALLNVIRSLGQPELSARIVEAFEEIRKSLELQESRWMQLSSTGGGGDTPVTLGVRLVTGNYTLQDVDDVLVCQEPAAGNITITLSPLSSSRKREIVVLCAQGTVLVQPSGGEALSGDSQILGSWGTLRFVPDSSTGVWRQSGQPWRLTQRGQLLTSDTNGMPYALNGNTAATRLFLRSTGSGAAANIPVWSPLIQSDVLPTLTNAIGATQLVDLSVTQQKLADAAVTTAKLQDAAVDTNKLALLAVDAARLADSSVGATKIANAAVGAAAIATAAIGTVHIGTGVIITAHIGDAQIVDAKIGSIAANKILAGTLGAGVIYTGSLTASQIQEAGRNGIIDWGNGSLIVGTISADAPGAHSYFNQLHCSALFTGAVYSTGYVGGSSFGGTLGGAMSFVDAAGTRSNLGAAAASHSHAQSDITNLTTDLAAKAAHPHTHSLTLEISISTDTLQYLDWSSAPQSKTVVTGVSITSASIGNDV